MLNAQPMVGAERLLVIDNLYENHGFWKLILAAFVGAWRRQQNQMLIDDLPNEIRRDIGLPDKPPNGLEPAHILWKVL